jgi:hypothetical protein
MGHYGTYIAEDVLDNEPMIVARRMKILTNSVDSKGSIWSLDRHIPKANNSTPIFVDGKHRCGSHLALKHVW